MDKDGGGSFPHGGDILFGYAAGEDEAQDLPSGIYGFQVVVFKSVNTRGRISHRTWFPGYLACCRRIVERGVVRAGRYMVAEDAFECLYVAWAVVKRRLEMLSSICGQAGVEG